MWWGGKQRLDVYVSERLVTICVAGAATWVQEVEHFDAAVEAAQGWMQRQSGRWALHIWLGAALCPPLFVAKVDRQFDQKARDQMAWAMAKQAFGPGDELYLWVEAPKLGDELVAAAARVEQLARLSALGHGRRVQLVRIAPWWCEVLDRFSDAQAPQPAAVLIADMEALVLAEGPPGAYSRLSTQPLSIDSNQRAQQLARTSVGLESTSRGAVLTVTLSGKLPNIASPPGYAAPIAMAPCALWSLRAA